MLVCLVATLAPASAQPPDVPRDHWAYECVNDLAEKGYVIGYPDGNFLGNRTLTRYEFACVVQRILQRLEADLAAAGDSAPPPVRDGAAVRPPVEPAVSQDDLQKVAKLVEEFKVELTVMGTRLDKLEGELTELKGKLENVEEVLGDEEGPLQSTRADVSKLKKVTVGGYVQARYQTVDFDKEDTTETHSIDTFLVRRARVKVTAKPTRRATAVLQMELGKNATSVKDAYVNYALGPGSDISPSLRIGQQNWWFGYEVPHSSSKRETPERVLFVRRFFPGERDQGAVLIGATDRPFNWVLGAYNGTGIEKSSSSDLNSAKDYLARVSWAGSNLDFGLSAYVGQGAWTKFGEAGAYLGNVDKVRYGADLQWYSGNLALKAEYIRGKGFDQAHASWDQNEYADGYYAQLNYNLNPFDTLVARYSSLSEDAVTFNKNYGRRSAWEVGYLRWLDPKIRMKLFYKVNKEERNEIDNDGFTAEWVATY